MNFYISELYLFWARYVSKKWKGKKKNSIVILQHKIYSWNVVFKYITKKLHITLWMKQSCQVWGKIIEQNFLLAKNRILCDANITIRCTQFYTIISNVEHREVGYNAHLKKSGPSISLLWPPSWFLLHNLQTSLIANMYTIKPGRMMPFQTDQCGRNWGRRNTFIWSNRTSRARNKYINKHLMQLPQISSQWTSQWLKLQVPMSMREMEQQRGIALWGIIHFELCVELV